MGRKTLHTCRKNRQGLVSKKFRRVQSLYFLKRELSFQLYGLKMIKPHSVKKMDTSKILHIIYFI